MDSTKITEEFNQEFNEELGAEEDIVTLIADPTCGTLPEPSPEAFASSESLEDQLDRLTKAISKQVEQDANEAIPLATGSVPMEELLAAQIAEDQALQQEINQEIESQNEIQQGAETDLNAEGIKPEARSMDLAEIQSCLEALLFISEKPLSLERLQTLLGTEYDPSLFETALQALVERYNQTHHGIELTQIAGGYQFRTKPGRAALAQKLVRVQTQRLSSGAMETLAIIAYKQPSMKEDVDKIRGVDSSYFIRGLLERKLIKICGRSELPGRPMLYSTTPEFLEVFGLSDLSALPSLRELEQVIPGSQTANPEDEDPKTREMRRMVAEMKSDKSSALYYNPKEDEKILKDIRERIGSIPVSTPYLDELKAAEVLAQQQAQAGDTQGTDQSTLFNQNSAS